MEKHLEFIEEQTNFQAEKSKLEFKTKAELIDYPTEPDEPPSKEEQAAREAWGEHEKFVNETLPRVLVNPFIVALWSFYESAIKETADFIQEKQGAELSLDDVRGRYFVDQVEKYFRYVLHFPVGYDEETKQHLELIAKLRNAIAHDSGRLRALDNNLADEIESRARKGIKAASVGDYFILKPVFAQQAFRVVRGNVDLLLERCWEL